MEMSVMNPKLDEAAEFGLVRLLVAALGVALAGIAVQALWIPLDADVSWLITVCERLLSGDRLYVDILEVNPPASVWLYLPLVALAKLVGARPEAVVVAGFAVGALASVAATVRLASKLDDCPRRLPLTLALSFIALVLPVALFAQREHAAFLLALPSATAIALIAEGKPLRPRSSAWAGLAAGLTIVIKPFFALAILAPALWALWKRRSLAPFVPAIAAATAIVAVYGIAIVALTPAYFDLVPMLAKIYTRMTPAVWTIFVGPMLFPAITAALVALVRPGSLPPLGIAWALAGAGFVLAAFIQAKNYPNHWYPGAAFALAAAFVVLATQAKVRRTIVAACLLILAAAELRQFTILPDPALARAIERVAPPSPSVIALSPQLTVGHPVTRNVGGHWVGSRAGLFTAHGARRVGLDDPDALAAYRDDLSTFAADIAGKRPDVVLVDRNSSWLWKEPVIAGAMKPYRPAARAGDIEIWVRR
jgi:hypothetical protein